MSRAKLKKNGIFVISGVIGLSQLLARIVKAINLERKMKYRAKKIKAEIDGREYLFKSLHECRVAEILQLWKKSGLIKDWAYEQTAFVFPDDKWRVDFDVTNNDGTFYYIEAKGYIDARTKRYIKLLHKYRPEVIVDFFIARRNDVKKFKTLRKFIRRIYVIKKGNYETV